MKPLFALFVLMVALLFACGCTGATSEETGAVAAPTAALPSTTAPPSATSNYGMGSGM